jgi:hypothetical protein
MLGCRNKREKERSGKSESGVSEEEGGSSLLHALRTGLRVALTISATCRWDIWPDFNICKLFVARALKSSLYANTDYVVR